MDEKISERFSPSKLAAYKNCPRQYKYRYVDRLRRDRQSVEAFLGTCVHSALEKLHFHVSHGRIPGEKEVVDVFDKAWEAGFTDKIVLRKKGVAAGDWRNVGRECVVNYYRANQPFDKDKTVALEGRVGFPLEVEESGTGAKETFLVEGFVDRLARGRDGFFEIHDYKTGGSLPTQAEKDEDWQLAIYNIAVNEAWKGLPGVRLLWHYVRFGQTIESRRSPQRLEALRSEIASLIGRIRGDRTFEPRQSSLCDWCDYRDICPLWKHVDAYERLPPEERRYESGVKLADEYAAVHLRKRKLREELAALESEESELERRLLEYSDRTGALAIEGTDTRLCVQAKEEYKFPTRTHAAEKLAEIENGLKATAAWPLVSRLDSRILMDGFKARRWPQEVLVLVEGWLDKLIKREIVRTVRAHKKKEAGDE